MDRLSENINNATRLSEKLYEEALSKNIHLQAIHLKAEDITQYKALFIADKEDFLSDDFREMYSIARRLKNEAESNTFYISFSFMPNSNNLSEDCLAANGFFMKYEKK